MRLIAGFVGKVKDFRPIFAKKEDLPEPPGKVKLDNYEIHFDIPILPLRGDEEK